MKIAIIGASGFIGTRLVECLVLNRKAEVVPIVRNYSSQTLISRYNLPSKVCDILDEKSLADSLSGCDAVIHAALGDPRQIGKMASSIYRAAVKARIKKLIVLSSASVHGQAPVSGTNEDSALHGRHALEYNNAKIKAEKILFKLYRQGNTELILLRPGIVYGPRSRLIGDIANQLINHTAYLINEGDGICNGIYVDNLIEAILLSLKSSRGDGEAFLVGDAETITWRQLYESIAESLGVELNSIHYVKTPIFKKSRKQNFEKLIASTIVQAALPVVPGNLKQKIKRMIGAYPSPPPLKVWTLKNYPQPPVTEEMCLLQQCSWKFPHDKAEKLLGYSPLVTFEEGMHRTFGWLNFAFG